MMVQAINSLGVAKYSRIFDAQNHYGNLLMMHVTLCVIYVLRFDLHHFQLNFRLFLGPVQNSQSCSSHLLRLSQFLFSFKH